MQGAGGLRVEGAGAQLVDGFIAGAGGAQGFGGGIQLAVTADLLAHCPLFGRQAGFQLGLLMAQLLGAEAAFVQAQLGEHELVLAQVAAEESLVFLVAEILRSQARQCLQVLGKALCAG